MIRTLPSIFVDTNIWLDYYLAERAYHAVACRFIDYVVSHEVVIYSCIPSLKDLYFLYQRERKKALRQAQGKLTPAQAEGIADHAWQIVKEVRQIVTFATLDAADVDYAIGLRPLHHDFEDDVILAAAHRVSADFLVTNDEKLRNHSPIRAYDPTTMYAVFDIVH